VYRFEVITWETIDKYTVKATITELGNTVSATIYFNEKWAISLRTCIMPKNRSGRPNLVRQSSMSAGSAQLDRKSVV
jgi:hypothetical protein